MSRMLRYSSISLCLCLVATAWAAPEAGRPDIAVVAFVPAADPVVNAALLSGLRAALASHDVRLVVGRASQRWSNAAPEAVRLVVEEHADVLITPPDRRVAHLMVQVATRIQVPVVSTSTAPTVGTTGSTWVACVQRAAPQEDWTAVGRRAGRAVLERLVK